MEDRETERQRDGGVCKPPTSLCLSFPPSRRLAPMQLDRTRIAIRERSLLETLDLALHVTREFFGPLVVCSLLAVIPLALINYALVGWMAPLTSDEDVTGFRFLWNMSLLIFLEAPLASVF